LVEVSSVVIMTSQVESCVAFYRTLGVPLEDEDHGDGILHAAVDIGGVHVAVVPAAGSGRSPGYRQSGSTFVGFWVSSLEATGMALQALGAEVFVKHEACEWGCRFVVADPDGRAVEVNQRAHCAAASG
jgi:lactoylglutathione lyase